MTLRLGSSVVTGNSSALLETKTEATLSCHAAIVEYRADSWHFAVAVVPRRVGTKVGLMVETQRLEDEIPALESVREDSLSLNVVGTCRSSEVIRIIAAD